jgi:hypothetical protein
VVQEPRAIVQGGEAMFRVVGKSCEDQLRWGTIYRFLDEIHTVHANRKITKGLKVLSWSNRSGVSCCYFLERACGTNINRQQVLKKR